MNILLWCRFKCEPFALRVAIVRSLVRAVGIVAEDDTDPAPLPTIAEIAPIAKLNVRAIRCQLIPKHVDLAFRIGRVLKNVVKSDNSTWPNERGVHLEVEPHSIIGVVAVDE